MGDLFIAGIIPGLLLAAVFALGVLIMAWLWPGFVGHNITRPAEDVSTEIGDLSRKGLPIASLIALVLGGIYGGFFTPIEAGAVGCLGAIIIGLARRQLRWADFWQVLTDTGLVTASICFLIIAAQMYSRMLALSGLPSGFGSMVATADIGFWGIILAYVAVVILMGTILDSSSIMLILVPLMLPVPVWHGCQSGMVWHRHRAGSGNRIAHTPLRHISVCHQGIAG